MFVIEFVLHFTLAQHKYGCTRADSTFLTFFRTVCQLIPNELFLLVFWWIPRKYISPSNSELFGSGEVHQITEPLLLAVSNERETSFTDKIKALYAKDGDVDDYHRKQRHEQGSHHSRRPAAVPNSHYTALNDSRTHVLNNFDQSYAHVKYKKQETWH